MCVGDDVPTSSCRIASRNIQHPITFYYIWGVVVELGISSVRCAKYIIGFACILCLFKVKHVAVIHSYRTISNTIIHLYFFSNGDILTTMLTPAHFEQRSCIGFVIRHVLCVNLETAVLLIVWVGYVNEQTVIRYSIEIMHLYTQVFQTFIFSRLTHFVKSLQLVLDSRTFRNQFVKTQVTVLILVNQS